MAFQYLFFHVFRFEVKIYYVGNGSAICSFQCQVGQKAEKCNINAHLSTVSS